MTMEGSSAYHLLGKNFKKNTRRPQGEYCFTGRAVVCLQGFVSASAKSFVLSVIMLTELAARSAFYIASNVHITN